MQTTTRAEEAAVLAAVRDGDAQGFATVAERYRRQLHVHCYRMLGSFDEAEDLVQETLLRAWRARETFEGRSLFRTWLYRIATNACLNVLQRSPRRVMPPDLGPPADGPFVEPAWSPEIPWLQPYPDFLLEPIAPSESEPDAVVVTRETIELAYLAAIQHLPPRQRAVLILRDALDWSARETAVLLETSEASVNSALQRARSTMRAHVPSGRTEWISGSDPTVRERSVLDSFMRAFEQGDADAMASLLRDDVRQTMPLAPLWFDGRDAVMGLLSKLLGSDAPGHFRLVPTTANRQPAAVCYLRLKGDTAYRFSGLNILRVEHGEIAEITSFHPDLCVGFEFPETLPADR